MPITYSIANFETYLNAKIQGKFYETIINPTKSDKDKVLIEMVKTGRITLHSKYGQLVCLVPLHVTATIEESRLNFITKGMKPVETDLEITVQTPADLDKNWNLVTKFKLVGIRWLNPPVVKIAGISFDLTNKIEEYLTENEEKLTHLLDDELNNMVSLEKPIAKIWNDIQQPLLIVKHTPRTYLKFICRSISGDIKIQDKELVCHTTIIAQATMVTERKLKAPAIPLPDFKPVPQNNLVSDAYVSAFAEFGNLNEILNAALSGQRFEGGNVSATIDSLRVYASDSGLTVAIDTKGDVNAQLVAFMQPRFDSQSQVFIMDDFQFKVSSHNVLVNAGYSLLYDQIRQAIQSSLTLEMDSLIRQLPLLIENAVQKGKTGKAIDLNVDELEIKSCLIEMDAKRIYFLVHVQLESGIVIKRINPGKKMDIKPKGE